MSNLPPAIASTPAPETVRFSAVPGTGRTSSIEDVAAAFDVGVSPVEVVEECLARLAARNGTVKAMIAIDAAGALAAARQAEAELRGGHRRGPLHGVPVAIKDMIDVAGWPTTAGSRLFDSESARRDASCIANLRAAGAIILGKANLHELTTGGHDNPWFGKVVNPLDSSRGTGGSSSGSAAAVAAGFCVAAIGTDSGGSNRSPAAATGLVGFKPSSGLIDTNGSRPTARSLDTIGSFTSTVRDGRLITEALCGRKSNARNGRRLSDIVVATCPDLYGAAVDPVVMRSHARWFADISNSGVRIVDLDFRDGEAAREAGINILKFEFHELYGDRASKHPERVGKGVHAFAAAARVVSRATYDQSIARCEEIKSRFCLSMDGIDVIAVPVAPGLAPRLCDEHTRVGDTMVSYGAAGANFRLWANFLDLPTLAMPLTCEEPLPASIQIAALPGQDWALFDIAEALSTQALQRA
jgi:Asp-tRNA(Asn)/Glu-tRNA(Gln) amidotransferase A subunit family amidase